MGDSSGNNTRIEQSNIYLTQHPADNSRQNSQILLPQQKLLQASDYPSISMRLVEDAINQELLPEEMRDKLIRNPNKCSIFFAKFDCDSPTTRDAMQKLDLTTDNLILQKYSETIDPKKDALFNLIQYLLYVTEQYKTLKDLVSLKLKLKREFLMNYSIKSQKDFNINTSLGMSSIQHFSSLSTRSIDFQLLPIEEKIKLIRDKNDNMDRVYEQNLINHQSIVKQKLQKIHQLQTRSQKQLEKCKQDREKQQKEFLKQNKEKMDQVMTRINYNRTKREELIEKQFKKLNLDNHNNFSQEKKHLNVSHSDSNLLSSGNQFTERFTMKLNQISNYKKELEGLDSQKRDQMMVEREAKEENAVFKHQLSMIEIQKKCQFHNQKVDRARQRFFDFYQTAQDQIINQYCSQEEQLVKQIKQKQEELELLQKEKSKQEKQQESQMDRNSEKIQMKIDKEKEQIAMKLTKLQERKQLREKQIEEQIQKKKELELQHYQNVKLHYIDNILDQNRKSDSIIEKHKEIKNRYQTSQNDEFKLIEASRSMHFENQQKRNNILESFVF